MSSELFRLAPPAALYRRLREAVVLLASIPSVLACSPETPRCDMPTPPAAALVQAGADGADLILPGGRRLTPTGNQTSLGGYPAEVLLHPTVDVAIVLNVGYALRAIQVVRRSDGMLIQTLARPELWHGMALGADGTELYVAGGNAHDVQVFAVDAATGALALDRVLAVDAYPAGMALSASANVLWTADFAGQRLLELDRTTGNIVRQVAFGSGLFSVLKVPGREELYVSDARGTTVSVVELAGFTVAQHIDVGGGGPIGFEATPDGSRVYSSVSDADRVIAIDTATRTIVADARLGEIEIEDGEGTALPGTSPAGAAYDAVHDQLLVARAADNVVAVLDGTSLVSLGTIPTGWYPTDVAIDGSSVVVANGKGIGAGPTSIVAGDAEGKSTMTGTLSSFDLATLDLAERTAQALSNWQRPHDVYAPSCGRREFPVPTAPGGQTPIEHIVLIVRENKTYDSVLGDLEGANGDPSLVMWDETVTPNVHAIAREFANHDNFYDDSESSVQGHFWLTYGFVNHYMEHISYLEDYRGSPGFGYDPAAPEGQPDVGSYFQHLIRHGIDFRIFGEVVGFAGSAVAPDGTTQMVSDRLDFEFPGLFYNTNVKDETKARHVALSLAAGPLPQFSYLLLPNDHTNGLATGAPTPNAMVSDNDYALGLVLEALSHHPDWGSTAVFMVQDDTQSGADHVDLHRSLLMIASPWARRGETSHVHTSYPSLFRTFNHILGLPPLNRYDAMATPLYDSFDTTPDMRPYDARPRQVPDEINKANGNKGFDIAMRWSDRIDFEVPDANPALGDILWLARFGEAPAGSVLERVIAGEARDHGPRTTGGEGDDDDDEAAYEREIAAARRRIERTPRLLHRLSPDGRRSLGIGPR